MLDCLTLNNLELIKKTETKLNVKQLKYRSIFEVCQK